jgi:hypothetical protein
VTKRLAAACTIGAIAASSRVAADPLALRADAFASTAAPAGLLSVSAGGDIGANLSAEAVVWTGHTGATGGDQAAADVLVMALHARSESGLATATIGRFVAMLGALRPVQVDGGSGRIVVAQRIQLEAYAGVPVEPDLATSRAWDWVVGGRASRPVGDWGSVGVAYMQQRSDGELATEEVGVDAGAAIGAHDDLAGKLAYDVLDPGLAEATLSASDRRGALRSEVYATYIAASHILPATSLFTVLGDVPAWRAGTVVTWRAAPRLDVAADLAIRRSDGDPIDGPAGSATTAIDRGEAYAPAIVLRATLRLDARGASALSAELRRDGSGDAGWTGARATARIALPYQLAASTELELVVPDDDRGLGRVWPWALAALSRSWGPWHAAVAVEAQASPEDRSRLDALAELGRTWGAK